MRQKPSSRRKRNSAKSILRLPDLEHAKTAVLNSLNSADAKRGYRHAIDEFVDWYYSEPRLAFNRIVVLRYRSHLESRQLALGTINLSLDAVRRLPKRTTAVCSAWIWQRAFAGSRCEEAGPAPRKLANARARTCTLARTPSSASERKTRPSVARATA